MAPGWWQKIKDGFGKVVSWVKDKAIPWVRDKIIPTAKKVWEGVKPIATPLLMSKGIPPQAIDSGIGAVEGITGALSGGDVGGAINSGLQFARDKPWMVSRGGPAISSIMKR
jgi:hypothetical protein